MAKKAKKTKPEATEVEANPVETTPAEAKPARGAKTAAVKEALAANPEKMPKEVAEMLQGQGWQVTAGYVSTIKTNMKGKTKAKAKAKKAAPAPASATEAAPALPKDAVSVALLQKAKKLAEQLGGIKEAKAAMDALAQILD